MAANPRPCNLCGEERQISFLYTRNGYSIHKCQRCGLVYVGVLPTAGELTELYGDSFFEASSKFDASANSPSLVNARDRVAQILRLPGIGRTRWLDVGCATGEFLLAGSEVAGELHGTDISAYAISEGRRRGLQNLRDGNFTDLDYSPEYFDLITMWDLIEHVEDPARVLHKAFAYLRPGGYLVLSTGDVDSLASKVMGRFWHLMIPPMHTYFFSRSTITRYLQEAGFTDLRITYTGKIVPLDFMVEKAARLVSPRLSQAVQPVLRKLGLGRVRFLINLFDIMTVVARKPAHAS